MGAAQEATLGSSVLLKACLCCLHLCLLPCSLCLHPVAQLFSLLQSVVLVTQCVLARNSSVLPPALCAPYCSYRLPTSSVGSLHPSFHTFHLCSLQTIVCSLQTHVCCMLLDECFLQPAHVLSAAFFSPCSLVVLPTACLYSLQPVCAPYSLHVLPTAPVLLPTSPLAFPEACVFTLQCSCAPFCPACVLPTTPRYSLYPVFSLCNILVLLTDSVLLPILSHVLSAALRFLLTSHAYPLHSALLHPFVCSLHPHPDPACSLHP